MRSIFALLLLIVVAQAVPTVLHADSPTVIPGQYIIVLNEGIDILERDIHIAELEELIIANADQESLVTRKYSVITGFSAKLSEQLVKHQLTHPRVKYVEADQVVTISDEPLVERSAQATVTQTGATWGLDRIDQRALPLNQQYIYDESAGAGATIFILDTGILYTHVDFGGRATFGFTDFGADGGVDRNGHGTHCAGTAAGTTYGVAKKAALVGVKVLSDSGSGSWAGVIGGVDYVVGASGTAKVASMSLGGGLTTALNDAVAAAVAAGVSFSVAAGNNGQNACNFSPASVKTAVTVGATTITDARSSFSNIGTCVDLFAPGSNIVSDYIGSNTAVATLSGTSMACPHVTGVIAMHLGHNPKATPAEVEAWLVKHATQGVITGAGTGSPNLLLYSPHHNA